MKKTFSLVFIVVLVVSSIILIQNASAQSIPKPSVPEFTINYVEHPYDVAPTYQIDQHSGENITIQQGYHIQNRSIEIIIKNQAFTPFEDSNGNQIQLFYNISAKGHFGSQWYYYPTWLRTLPVTASNSDHTVLSFGLDVNYEEDNQYGFWYGDLSVGDQEDFRVQAQIGYYKYPLYNRTLEDNEFTGEVSDWSSTQTFTVPEASALLSPSPTVPEVSVIAILPLLLLVPLVVVILRSKRLKVNHSWVAP